MQELSAIQINALTKQIVDVYHQHANSEVQDFWPRLHIHGLSKVFLKNHALPDEEALIQDFKKWLRGKDVLAMYANNPDKEKQCLGLPIKDMPLPKWSERTNQPYHRMAHSFKNNFIPILDKRCCSAAHASFSNYKMKRDSESELAKYQFGFHCSLYDAYELYLYYVCN